jgi:hypothetical protein
VTIISKLKGVEIIAWRQRLGPRPHRVGGWHVLQGIGAQALAPGGRQGNAPAGALPAVVQAWRVRRAHVALRTIVLRSGLCCDSGTFPEVSWR